MNPLIILLIAIIAVVGMIIVLRLNAFIALTTAAILVSLLAPGAAEDKISRVAREFGSVAGNIGIVIALAAIVAKCLLDSGAADQIVRSFLRLLGEKRASW
ncbi:MAG: gluconate permease, partial [Planctomycetota bacterium]